MIVLKNWCFITIFRLEVIIFLRNFFFPEWQNIFLETNIKPNYQAFEERKKLVEKLWENMIRYFPQHVYIASCGFSKQQEFEGNVCVRGEGRESPTASLKQRFCMLENRGNLRRWTWYKLCEVLKSKQKLDSMK